MFDVTLGVEEEFFLVDPETMNVVADPDPRVFADGKAEAGSHDVVNELLRCQIETNTRVCHSIREVREAVTEVRQVAAKVAERHGMAIMAASTHPFSRWQDQRPTPQKRYESFMMVYQDAVRRFNISGMHCHAGFGADGDSRMRVMTAIRRYLPVLLALSSSSPFLSGQDTGMKSSRSNTMTGLTRTGMPNALYTQKQFDEIVEGCKRMETIRDASELWWDIRPSGKYPTIEMRICDVCSKVDDLVAVIALYACLIRYLMRLDARNGLPQEWPTELINENRWLAQRYGVLAFLGDPVNGGRIDIHDYLKNLLDTVSEDAAALDCEKELKHLETVVTLGSSADRQSEVYNAALLDGKSHDDALKAVVKSLLAETIAAPA